MGKNRQSAAFRVNGCMGGDLVRPCFLASPLTEDTVQGVGITDLYFTRRDRQRGSAASKPQTRHAASTCRNSYTGWGRARSGTLGPSDTHSTPARTLGLWVLLSPPKPGDRGLGCFPMAGTLSLWSEGKTAQGVWSLASLQHSVLYRVGAALPTGEAWPHTQDSTGLAGRGSIHLLVSNRARP